MTVLGLCQAFLIHRSPTIDQAFSTAFLSTVACVAADNDRISSINNCGK